MMRPAQSDVFETEVVLLYESIRPHYEMH